MSTMTRWDPFRELTTLRDEMNRLFSRAVPEAGRGGQASTWSPAVDVFDTADAIVLKAELPGLKPEEVEVEVDDDVLSIRGERTFREEVEEGRYHRIERAYGAFARTMALPAGVKAGEITASFTDGVLEVRVPKAEQATPRKITISAQS